GDAADDLAKGREEDRVLARGVGPVHALEGPQETAERRVRLPGSRPAQDLVRDLAAARVLTAEHRHQRHLAVRRLEPWEDEVLLLLLVILLDESVDDPCGGRKLGRIEVLPAIDALRRLVVDQEDPLEDAVLLHEVLARRDLRLVGVLVPNVRRALLL